MTENTQPVETFELSESDKADLDKMLNEANPPKYHAILEVWREVLDNGRRELEAKVEASWASRITQSYSQIRMQEMETFRDLYFGKVIELLDILEAEIDGDPKALSVTTAKEDVAENSDHYKNLLLTWQMAFQQWEIDWHCTDENAHLEIAAIAEAHKMFFSQNGVTAFLDSINFEFTEDDQKILAEALASQREEAS